MNVREVVYNPFQHIGSAVLGTIAYIGGLMLLLGSTLKWTLAGIFTKRVRFPFRSMVDQLGRVGVLSFPIVITVQFAVGIILTLQMIPTLEPWGLADRVANIIGVGGFRMLGPIFTGTVLSGFAGASIAAELGTMVVAEEIEAMRAMAMNPIRFLVVPRVIATFLAMILLTVIADLMISLGGYTTVRIVLGSTAHMRYWSLMQGQLRFLDLATGLIQAGLFGLLIGLISCFEGLSVRGGAAGVGRATTMTVVFSLVSILFTACICTMIFYVFEL